jgi:YbbR domain-containing protein
MSGLTRFFRFVFRNWPLKLAAVAMATLLYGGLVLSQATRPFSGLIPIEAVNQPSDVTILSDLGSVRQVRFLAPEDLGLRIDSSTFRATVDLSAVAATGGPVSVPVRVQPVDARIQILDYEPSRIIVRLDTVISRTVPIRAVLGTVPPNLDTGTPVLDTTDVVVTGPKSIVDRVVEAQARVQIDASGIDINRLVDLVPVDGGGEALNPVDMEPTAVRVKVAVFTDRQTRTVPVTPQVNGSPAAGFELAGPIEVVPSVVSVAGDANDLAAVDVARTAPIDIAGATRDVVATVTLQLPDGVEAVGDSSVSVTIHIRPVSGTRTFQAGLELRGASGDLQYSLSTDRVVVTAGGSIAALNDVAAASLVATLDVAGLTPGAHTVNAAVALPSGLTLVSVSPSQVTVTITAVVASPPPAPTPTPTPTP